MYLFGTFVRSQEWMDEVDEKDELSEGFYNSVRREMKMREMGRMEI